MGVKDLRGIRPQSRFDCFGEGANVSREGGQRYGVSWTRLDMDNPVTRHDIDYLGIVEIVAPGEHVDFDSSRRHGPRKLVDVDVHAASITGTRLE